MSNMNQYEIAAGIFTQLAALKSQNLPKDYMIVICREDVKVYAIAENQFNDRKYYAAALGFVEDFTESESDIIYSAAEFLQSEEFVDDLRFFN